jgi:hypothetical protein
MILDFSKSNDCQNQYIRILHSDYIVEKHVTDEFCFIKFSYTYSISLLDKLKCHEK